MKKTKILFASLALCGFMGLAYAASDAVTSPDAPETPGAAGSEEKVGTITDEITAWTIGNPSSNWKYETHEGVKAVSDAEYTFQCGLPSQGYILFRATNMNSGFITSTQGGDVKEITVEFGNASYVPGVIDAAIPGDPEKAPKLTVLGSHTPYNAVTDLFYPTTMGDELGEITEEEPTFALDGSYEYIGVRVADAYTVAVSSIKVTLEGPQYYVEAPVFVDPENEATVYGATVNLPTVSALTCATEGATIYYKEGEDGEWVKYDAEKFNPNYEVTYYAYATTHEDNCKSAETTLEYIFKPIDNLVDAAAEPVGAPYKYVGELVVVAATGEVWDPYPGDPGCPGMTTIVYDGTNFGMFYEKDVQVYKGNYIAAGWVAETLADGTIAAYGSTAPVVVDDSATEAFGAANNAAKDTKVVCPGFTIDGTYVASGSSKVNVYDGDKGMKMRANRTDNTLILTVDEGKEITALKMGVVTNDAAQTLPIVAVLIDGEDANLTYPIATFNTSNADGSAVIDLSDISAKESIGFKFDEADYTSKNVQVFIAGEVTYQTASEDDAEGDAEEEEVVYIVPADGKVKTAGWVESLPVATAYDNVADCKTANNYCTINNVVFAEETPAQDKTAEALVGEKKDKITVKNVFLGTEAAGTYNVTGMWVAEGKNLVFVPVRYVHVTEEFDLTNLYGNYDFLYGYCSTNEDDMVDTDAFNNKTKRVAVRPGENANEVVITGIAPGLSFSITGVVEYYWTKVPKMGEDGKYIEDENGDTKLFDELSDNGKITIEACDVEIDGVKYRMSESTQTWYDPMVFTVYGTTIMGGFGLSKYNSEDRDWTAYVAENFGLTKYIPTDLYLFGEMNAWGNNDEEKNDAWKFKSYDGLTYTLIVPEDIPADKMFIVADGVYDEDNTNVMSWGGVTGMDLNKDYTIYLQNPFYVSHCNLAETFEKGSTVTVVFGDKDGVRIDKDATITFTRTTAIEAIDAVAGDAVYYNINGVKVENPAQGGVYIRVINGKATKVYVK